MSGVTSLLHGRLSYFAYSPQSPDSADRSAKTSGRRLPRSGASALLVAGVLAGFVMTLAAATAHAQLPVPQLTSIFPLGLKQGTSADITLSGTDLDEADKLLFSHPGITAAPKMTEPSDFVKSPRPVGTSFTVKVDGSVPPGSYEVRAINRFGISNPRVFRVSDQEEVVKVAGNNSLEKAQELALGAIVSGRVDANARDFYKVNLAAGQRVLVETWAERIDSKMDTTLAIFGPDGRELSRSRDVDSRDAILDFTPPAAGQYVVAVFDFLYGGGADYFYRLSVHTKPRIEFVFPPAGPAGSNNSYTIYGRNLPGGQPAPGVVLNGITLQKMTANIAIPADSAARSTVEAVPMPRASLVDRIDFRLPGSNAVSVAVATSAPILEVEPNDTPAKAQKITVPCEIAGQFYPSRDADWLQFDAKKGDVFMMEVVSHRLGLECDPLLIVKKVGKNDKGEETMTDVANVDDPQDRTARIGGDFDTSTDDPSYKFTASEDATYRVMVRDQFGDSRLDPRNVYRLIIRKDEPSFQALVVATVPAAAAQNNQPGPIVLGGPVLRRGGSTMLQFTVDRRDDFKGEVTVTIEGLPAGVTCPGAILGGDVNSAALILSAEENAAAFSGPIRVIAKAQVNGQEVVRVARTGTVSWGSANRQQATPTFRTTRDLVLAVTDKETAPAFVKAGDDKVWETSLGGKLEVPLNLTRRGDYKEAVKLTAVGLPAEIKPAEVNLDPNTAAGKLEIPVTNQATKPGVYTFYLRSDTKMKYARNPDAVKSAEEDQALVVARVAERDKAVKDATAAKDAATKAATDSTAAAKQAEQAKTAATAAAKQAMDAAKQAADKLTAAKDAAGKNAGDAKLAEAATAAQKAADETAAAATKAAEAVTAADKTLTDAQAKAKEADAAKTKSEQALKEAQDKLTQANQKKTEADKRVADMKTANTPKDVNLPLISTPIKLRVLPSPMKVSAAAPQVAVKQGEKATVSFKLERLFGFADVAEFAIEAPPGVAGLAAPKVNVPNGQSEAKLEVTADKNATVGEHAFTVRVKAKFNNVNVETTEKVVVKVDKAS